MDSPTPDQPQPGQNAGTNSAAPTVRKKRRSSFWDPLFDPNFKGTNNVFDWMTGTVTGVRNSLCSSDKLVETMAQKSASRWSIRNFKFQSCDFQGSFTTMDLSFNECEFVDADLGLSIWKNIKFSKCTFIRCSFTLATFEQCQFIECTWKDIGISGTETKLFETTISNPWDFINSAYTNTNKEVLKQRGDTNPAHQLMRLEETKVKLARSVLSASERNADDVVYYEAVKTYLTQALKARKVRATYDRDTTDSTKVRLLSSWKSLLADGELIILNASGTINAWGFSLARSALVGVALIIAFMAIYYTLGIANSGWLALMMSFDVTLLVGYTKHATENSIWLAQFLYALNALLGLWWYAIFVPTVINRISRVR
ncbi:hypothetical protein [Burkholderia stagnalis]|uniref:anti-phage Hailong system effector protein HalA n=1 Tax=Burkholderia stagnalis TaxID=1503054 RepID=UPI000AD7D94E|nr:hypothetical protein [Burkholderia stagnalis]